ncbi:MAG: DUF2254 family protein [Nitriliruptoraceae bacterium]
MPSLPSRYGAPVTATRTRRLVRRLEGNAIVTPLAYIVGGATVAVAMLLVDAAVGEQAIPDWLRLGPSLARSSLIGLGTSFVFVVSVVFWIRVFTVQTASQPALPRVVSQFLSDPVQRHSMSFLIGTIAYVLIVVRAVPEDPTGMRTVPHLAATLAFALALAVPITIVLVVDNAARAGQIGRLVRQISDRAVAHIRASHPPLGEGTSDGVGSSTAVPQRPAEATAAVLGAHDSGWVRSVEEEWLLGAVPPDATIELRVRPGSFVFQDTQLVRIWTARPDEVDIEQLRGSITLGTAPSFDEDIAFSIGELVDIITRAATASSSDSTTARSAIFHLGVVLRELLLRDLPCVDRTDHAGRRLLRTQQPRLEDYAEAALGPLRPLMDTAPGLAEVLLEMLDRLSHQLEEQLGHHGVAERADMLQRHRRALHEAAPTGDLRPGAVRGIGAHQPSETSPATT